MVAVVERSDGGTLTRRGSEGRSFLLSGSFFFLSLSCGWCWVVSLNDEVCLFWFDA